MKDLLTVPVLKNEMDAFFNGSFYYQTMSDFSVRKFDADGNYLYTFVPSSREYASFYNA